MDGGRAPYVTRNEMREAKWDGNRQLSDKITTSFVAKVSADCNACRARWLSIATTKQYEISKCVERVLGFECISVLRYDSASVYPSVTSETDVPGDIVGRFYQGVLYFQIVTRLHDTRECNFIYASMDSTAFPESVCPKPRNAKRHYVHISDTELNQI